jgi:hypothetical protein
MTPPSPCHHQKMMRREAQGDLPLGKLSSSPPPGAPISRLDEPLADSELRLPNPPFVAPVRQYKDFLHCGVAQGPWRGGPGTRARSSWREA